MSTTTKAPPAAKPGESNGQQRAPDPHQVAGKALLEAALDREVTFTPFMANEPIALSVRTVLTYFAPTTKKGFTCDSKQAMRFVMLCKSRGLDPWQGDAYIVGYDSDKYGPQFNLITAHQAYLKRAEVHPQYDGMESGAIVKRPTGGMVGDQPIYQTLEVEGDYIDPTDILMGGWAKVHRRDRKHPMYRRLRLTVFNQQRSRWNDDPCGMIVKCAEADALRSAFPNSYGGMRLEDEGPLMDSGDTEEAFAPPIFSDEEPAPAPVQRAPEVQRGEATGTQQAAKATDRAEKWATLAATVKSLKANGQWDEGKHDDILQRFGVKFPAELRTEDIAKVTVAILAEMVPQTPQRQPGDDDPNADAEPGSGELFGGTGETAAHSGKR